MIRRADYRGGAEDGPLVVYLHGAPGGPRECARFDAAARVAGVRLVGLDRGAVAPDLTGEAYVRRLAQAIDDLAAGRPAHLVGFSLGAFVTLRLTPYLAQRPASIHLVSAAAPLQGGDFLDAMAGRAVFTTAARSPFLFRRLTAFQGWLAARARGTLFGMLFSSAAGADRDLAANADFREALGDILDQALNRRRAGYLRDVEAYLQPWADGLGAIEADTYLWQGSVDNWTPPAMAHCLQALIPGVRRLETVDGASHYSSLFQAVPRILAQVGATAHHPEEVA